MRSALFPPQKLLLAAAAFSAMAFVAIPYLHAAARIDSQPPLSGKAIGDLISGTTVHLHTPIGTVIPVLYRTDGTLSGKAGMVAFYLGAATDKGRWWVAKGKLCQKWNVWFKGKKNCLQIRQKGARFHWRDGKGESGLATIVSRPIATASGRKVVKKLKPIRQPTGLGGALPAPAKKKATLSVTKSKAVSATATARTKSKVVVLNTPNPARAPNRGKVAQTTTTSQAIKAPATPQVQAKRQAQPAHPAPNKAATRRPPQTFRVTGVRNDDVLNVRSNPSPEAQIVATIPPNADNVRVAGFCANSWCPVVYKNRRGWVSRDYLTANRGNGNGARRIPARRQLSFKVARVVTGDVLNIRAEPTQSAPIVGSIAPNAHGIQPAGPCYGDWCRISYARKTGWVNRYYIAPANR